MMIHLTIDTALLLAILATTLGLLALAFTVHQWRVARRLGGRCLALEAGLLSLQREIESASSLSVRAGRRTKRMEQDFSILSDRMTALESRAEGPSFDQAIDSARCRTRQTGAALWSEPRRGGSRDPSSRQNQNPLTGPQVLRDVADALQFEFVGFVAEGFEQCRCIPLAHRRQREQPLAIGGRGGTQRKSVRLDPIGHG